MSAIGVITLIVPLVFAGVALVLCYTVGVAGVADLLGIHYNSLRLFFSLVAVTFILIGILVLFGSPVYIGSSMSGVPGEIVTGTWRIVSAVSDILSGFVFGYLRLTMFDGDED